MIDNSLDDRIHKLRESLERLVNDNDDAKTEENKKTTLDKLSEFGLSISQANAWLKKEPNYIADDILQRKEDRRGLDRTTFFTLSATFPFFSSVLFCVFLK